MDDFSPMMRQYLDLKKQYKDELLFFRLGDFYEMFFEDAITASRELEIVLTERACGGNKKAPMCGVPFHSADSYISRLIGKGFRVAICEQTSQPQKGKAIVERQIVRVVTPGTVTEENILSRERNNYLCCVYSEGDNAAAAWADISTGELAFCALESMQKLNELLSRIEPSEIICNSEMQLKSVNLSTVKYGAVCAFSVFDDTAFLPAAAKNLILARLGQRFLTSLEGKDECIPATGALLKYIDFTQKKRLEHLKPAYCDECDRMSLDANARRNLELFSSVSDGKKRGSLLWAIDRTRTAMGARMLRTWLESPLLDAKLISARQDAIAELLGDKQLRGEDIALTLNDCIRDIERIAGRLSCGNISPRDCYALGDSLSCIPRIKTLLSGFKSPLFETLDKDIGAHEDLSSLILRSIKSEPSGSINEGGVINKGFDETLDKHLGFKEDAAIILQRFEKMEREVTGIKNLKVAFNKVLGFYIEVTKSNLSLVPYRYTRKGSTINSERYITDDLKEYEEAYLAADENAVAREVEIYGAILERAKQEIEGIQRTATALARLDCLLSLAICARENNYERPVVTDAHNSIKIREGRHPVVEKLMGLRADLVGGRVDLMIARTDSLNVRAESLVSMDNALVDRGKGFVSGGFVPNDTELDADNRIMVITGPNMAGKSIYMRQVALIVILAQIGSFVPAASAEIGIIDRIFTRIGAGDDLKTGRSTFMVEMNESRDILLHSTEKSLILLDEVGRGTATYDGMSIAYAILKYIATKVGAKTLFATHYHELTELEGVLPGIKNFHAGVRELKGDIIFMHKLLKGAAGKSYGIEVARLAELPNEVIDDARQMLKHLESQSLGVSVVGEKKAADLDSNIIKESLCENPVLTKLQAIDTDLMSPMEALNFLVNLKKEVNKQRV